MQFSVTDSKSFEQYLDEYYGLECEDMIGDLKCRFPYRDVPANDYGLTVNEVSKIVTHFCQWLRLVDDFKFNWSTTLDYSTFWS